MLPSDQGMIWMNNMFTCYVPKAFEVLVNKKLDGQLDQAWMWMESMDIHDIQPIEIATRWFCSMVGGEYDYYGSVDNQIKLNDMIFEFIEDDSIGFLSPLAIKREVALGLLQEVNIPGLLIERSFNFVTRTGESLTDTTRAFIREAKSIYN